MASPTEPTKDLDRVFISMPADSNPFLCAVCGTQECNAKPLVKCEACKRHLHLKCGGFDFPVDEHVLNSLFWSWKCRPCFNTSSVPMQSCYGGQDGEFSLLNAMRDMENRLLARIDKLSVLLAAKVAEKNGDEQVTEIRDDNEIPRDQMLSDSGEAPYSGNANKSSEAESAQSALPGARTLKASTVNCVAAADTSAADNKRKARRTRRKRNVQQQASSRMTSSSPKKSEDTPQMNAVGTAVLNSIKETFASVLINGKPRDNISQAKHSGSIVGTRQRATRLRAVCNRDSAGVEDDLFITRLIPDTTPECVRSHILACTGRRVAVSKLRTRYDTYASFRISCQGMSQTLLNPDVWPKGVLVQRYRGNKA